MLRHCTLLNLFLLSIHLTDRATVQEKYEKFPSAGLEIICPEGFERSTDFEGLILHEVGASVGFVVIPDSTPKSSRLAATAKQCGEYQPMTKVRIQ
jgi:hypothetical protein